MQNHDYAYAYCRDLAGRVQPVGWIGAAGTRHFVFSPARLDTVPDGWRLAPAPLVMSDAPPAALLASNQTTSFPVSTGAQGVGIVVLDECGIATELIGVSNADPAGGRPLAVEEYDALADFAAARASLGDPLFRDEAGPLTSLLAYPPDPGRVPELERVSYLSFPWCEHELTTSVVTLDEEGFIVSWFVLDEILRVVDSLGAPPGESLLARHELTTEFMLRRERAGDPAFEELTSESSSDVLMEIDD